jgi:hypothetical protein
LQAHISRDRSLLGHCEDVCTPDTMVCALVRGSTRDVRRGWYGQKPLICMHFHGVFLGSQHESWSKQHNGKVSRLRSIKTPQILIVELRHHARGHYEYYKIAGRENQTGNYRSFKINQNSPNINGGLVTSDNYFRVM